MSSISEDEQSPIASQLFTMGRLIRDICGRDLGNKLLDAIEPIEEEMHAAIRQYAAKDRLDELEWCLKREGDAIAAECISRRIKQLKEGM